MSSPQRESVDYGIDAPQVVLWNGLGALAYLSIGIFFLARGESISSLGWFFFGGACWLASPLLLLLSSKVGKLRQRDIILNGIGFKGDERVLDIGTGHGLMVIGAAKRAPRGSAIGVDIWQQGDQGDNSRENTQRNIELEGVAANCTVQDGDARQLPFGDNEFDIVLANFALHNIPGDEGKRRACYEIARVLKSGGRLYNYDMFFTLGPFAKHLTAAGLSVSRGPLQWRTYPPGYLLTAMRSA